MQIPYVVDKWKSRPGREPATWINGITIKNVLKKKIGRLIVFNCGLEHGGIIEIIPP
jgi:hypothetical protein